MVHILKTKNGQFRVKVVARNGKLLHHSEQIKDRKSVLKNIAALQKAVLAGVKDHTK